MNKVLVTAISGFILGGAVLCSDVQAQTFGFQELTVGMYRIEAELAYTPAGREQGLMYRRQMAEHRGMLFSFPQAASHCMWMKNTLLPLSVAFLDEHGSIINIEEMQPQTENNHCAARPARYALEMNAGWFKRHGLGAGATINGVNKAPRGR